MTNFLDLLLQNVFKLERLMKNVQNCVNTNASNLYCFVSTAPTSGWIDSSWRVTQMRYFLEPQYAGKTAAKKIDYEKI